MSVSVSHKFNQIAKNKRGVSTDTFTFYANKNEEKENRKFKSKSKSKIKITYCPRIHNDKVMKQWEEKNSLKWYTLSPTSRQRANDEMTTMMKNNEIIL